jgi:hypothetical protein
MSLKRDLLNPNRYSYLSVEDSILYDKYKDSDNPEAKMIIKLLEDKADGSRNSHCASTY